MKIDLGSFGQFIRKVKYDEKRVLPIIERNLEKYERLGDALLAIEDLLKNNPETEESELVGEIDGNIFRTIRTDPKFEAPGITLLYYVAGFHIMVWGIRIIDE